MNAHRPVRVRFAPSPTGKLHIGGARTALFNWAFARRQAGTFVLRVEDTDAERNTEESLQSILDSLRWLGLNWDEGPQVSGDFGPYFQSQRQDLYRAAIDELLETGSLYRCFCSAKRLSDLREHQQANKQTVRYDGHCRGLDAADADARVQRGEAFTLRFRVPADTEVVIPDLIRGEVRFQSIEVEDWVAVRSNGAPTYNFVCVVDDAAMQISHVIRGEEHLINTPKQVLLYRALGKEEPFYAHVPLILGSDGKKLSKRTGDTAVGDYQSKGYPPEALFNFLCLLGFSIDDKTEVFSPTEMVEAFDLKRINKAGAIFDVDKLHWLCGDYVRRMDLELLTERVRPWLEANLAAAKVKDDAWMKKLVASQQERIQLYSELPEKVKFIFDDPLVPDPKAAKALRAEGAAQVMDHLYAQLEKEANFPPVDFHAWAKAFAEQHEIGLGKVMKPTRAALTGSLSGPDLGQVLDLLGKEKTLARLRAATELAQA